MHRRIVVLRRSAQDWHSGKAFKTWRRLHRPRRCLSRKAKLMKAYYMYEQFEGWERSYRYMAAEAGYLVLGPEELTLERK